MSHDFRETLQFYLIDCRTALVKAIDIIIDTEPEGIQDIQISEVYCRSLLFLWEHKHAVTESNSSLYHHTHDFFYFFRTVFFRGT